jgi:hypothetical protein
MLTVSSSCMDGGYITEGDVLEGYLVKYEDPK